MASVWDLAEYKPYQTQFEARQRAIQTNIDWYTGKIYEAKNVPILGQFQTQVKALYHPLARATDLHAAFLPGFPAYQFTRDTKQYKVEGEEVIVPGTPDADVELVKKLMKASRWAEYGGLYHKDYALKGKAVLSITNREERSPNTPVVIEVRNSAAVMPVFVDKWDVWPVVAFQVDRRRVIIDGEEKEGEYAVVFTPTEILTYFEGEPFTGPKNFDGTPGVQARVPNEYGFIPMVEASFPDNGNVFTNVIPVIQTVNKMATFIMGVVGQYFKPQAFISGAERGDEDIEWGEGIAYGPDGSDAKLLLADLDIAGASKFVESVHNEIKANLPELIFDAIRGINRISTEGLELQFAELISRLTNTRAGSDRALNDIFKLGLWAATEAAMPGFEGQRPDPLAPEWDEQILELDPLRGYVPFGESALLAIEKQRLEVEGLRIKTKTLEEEGQLRLEQMQRAIETAGSSGPTGTETNRPNPQGKGPDATSPGPKQTARPEPQER
jgi:hypothetical protein